MPIIGLFNPESLDPQTKEALEPVIAALQILPINGWMVDSPTLSTDVGTAGGVTTMRYARLGSILFFSCWINNATVTLTPGSLYLSIPGGLTVKTDAGGAFGYSNNGGPNYINNDIGWWFAKTGEKRITLRTRTGAAWANSAANSAFYPSGMLVVG